MNYKFLFSLLLVSVLLFLSGCTGQVPVCGDGICQFGEDDPSSRFYCPQDCGIITPDCGDGICDAGENDPSSPFYCPTDCRTIEQKGVLEIGVYDNRTQIGIEETEIKVQEVISNKDCFIDLTRDIDEYLYTNNRGTVIENFRPGTYALDFVAIGYDNREVICVDILPEQVTSIDHFLEKLTGKPLCENVDEDKVVLGHTETIVVRDKQGSEIELRVSEIFYTGIAGDWEEGYGAQFKLLIEDNEIGFLEATPQENLTSKLSELIELEESVTYVSNCWESQEDTWHKAVLKINYTN